MTFILIHQHFKAMSWFNRQ